MRIIAACLACALSIGIATGSAAQAESHSEDAATETAEAVQSPEQTAAERVYHNAQQASLASLQTKDGWYTMEGGLRWRYVRYLGAGESPTVDDTVTVHYAGTFIDGEGFDSSYERGEPATFPLGRLVPAWQMAIPQMRVGEKIEIAAPASLAYGPRGRGPIPGGATLLFSVELLEIVEC